MRNFDKLMELSSPEEFAYVYKQLQQYALYANGRLLSSSVDDFIEWLRKESDTTDEQLFDSKIKKCSKCGSLPTLITYEDGSFGYHCYGCGHVNYDPSIVHRTELSARVAWNY